MSLSYTVFVTVPGSPRQWMRDFDAPAIAGRSDDCEIPLPHQLVSRRHAQFARLPNGDLTIRDLGSTNGTIVDNTILRDEELRVSDHAQLHIGPYSLVLSSEARPDSSTLPLSGPIDAAAQVAGESATPADSLLTPRELEVIRLIALGRTNEQIAEDLAITTHTVIRHVTHILAKVDAVNRVQIAAFAFRHGLIR